MTKPLVSIITPCYNGEAFLKRYFESILNQTYPNLELIFINDGSTDRTEEIALSYRERLEKRGITYIYEKTGKCRAGSSIESWIEVIYRGVPHMARFG